MPSSPPPDPSTDSPYGGPPYYWPPPDRGPDRRPGRGGFLAFFTSLPALLTALAGMLTAVVAYLSFSAQHPGPEPAAAGTTAAVMSVGEDRGPRVDSTAAVSTQSDTGPSAPSASTVDTTTVRIDSGVDLGPVTSSANGGLLQDEANGCLQGSDVSCADLLDTLATNCRDGLGGSCDVLYAISPVGSSYQAFGATCGGRYDDSYAGACSER